jgi:fumarate hydratase class II
MGTEGSQTRIERDSMGEMSVPADAMYGASTARAVENFPISDLRFPREFIWALGLIKKHAATTNAELNLLDTPLATISSSIFSKRVPALPPT